MGEDLSDRFKGRQGADRVQGAPLNVLVQKRNHLLPLDAVPLGPSAEFQRFSEQLFDWPGGNGRNPGEQVPELARVPLACRAGCPGYQFGGDRRGPVEFHDRTQRPREQEANRCGDAVHKLLPPPHRGRSAEITPHPNGGIPPEQDNGVCCSKVHNGPLCCLCSRRQTIDGKIHNVVQNAVRAFPHGPKVTGLSRRIGHTGSMTAHTLIQTAEMELLESSTRGNAPRVRELLHPDFLEIGRSGRRWTRAEVIEALNREAARPVPDTDEWDFTELAPHLVLVTYRIRSGTRQSRHASLWDTSAATARLRYHQGTVVPPDFE